MVARLDALQPVFPLPEIDEIPDEEEDKPVEGHPMASISVIYRTYQAFLNLK